MIDQRGTATADAGEGARATYNTTRLKELCTALTMTTGNAVIARSLAKPGDKAIPTDPVAQRPRPRRDCFASLAMTTATLSLRGAWRSQATKQSRRTRWLAALAHDEIASLRSQ